MFLSICFLNITLVISVFHYFHLQLRSSLFELDDGIQPTDFESVAKPRKMVGSNRSGSGLSAHAKHQLQTMELERKAIRAYGKWDTCV